jgi:hypothetical protein
VEEMFKLQELLNCIPVRVTREAHAWNRNVGWANGRQVPAAREDGSPARLLLRTFRYPRRKYGVQTWR